MSNDEYNLIKSKFIRKYPNIDDYNNRIDLEINLIKKKILLDIYLKFVIY